MKLTHAGVIGGLAGYIYAHVLTDGAKILPQPGVILETDFLVAKKQDAEFKEGAFDFGEFQVREGIRQIDIADLRADRGAGGGNGNSLIFGASG
jgi:hypothetical protein